MAQQDQGGALLLHGIPPLVGMLLPVVDQDGRGWVYWPVHATSGNLWMKLTDRTFEWQMVRSVAYQLIALLQVMVSATEHLRQNDTPLDDADLVAPIVTVDPGAYGKIEVVLERGNDLVVEVDPEEAGSYTIHIAARLATMIARTTIAAIGRGVVTRPPS